MGEMGRVGGRERERLQMPITLIHCAELQPTLQHLSLSRSLWHHGYCIKPSSCGSLAFKNIKKKKKKKWKSENRQRNISTLQTTATTHIALKGRNLTRE